MFTILLAALFTYVNAPFAEMRLEPSKDSKVDSSGIYSERVEVVQEQGEWTKIQTPDGYAGWTKKGLLHQAEQSFPSTQDIAVINRPAAHIYHVDDTEWGPILTLPFESKLEVLDQFGDPNGRWLKVKLVDGTVAFVQRGDIVLNPQPINRDEMLALSLRFLGLPYTWGGRTSLGYDCSGFVQMLYRQMGIAIPRNSKDQAAWSGFQEVAVEDMKAGDLIFYGREPGKITHVGMYLGQGKFIHSVVRENKPYLRISNLTDPYWSNEGTFKYRYARTLK